MPSGRPSASPSLMPLERPSASARPSMMPSKKAGIGPSSVFFDLDEDGMRDPGEQLLRGVNVTLYQGDGTAVSSVITDAGGMYEFTGLEPGEYYVAVEPEYKCNDNHVFGPVVGGDGNSIYQANGTMAIKFLGYRENVDWSAGMYLPLSTIRGYPALAPALGGWGCTPGSGGGNGTSPASTSVVFEDLDGDGVRDPGEGPRDSVAIASDLTDDNGTYFFGRLYPESYHISVQPEKDGNVNYYFSSPSRVDKSCLGNKAFANGTTAALDIGYSEAIKCLSGANDPSAGAFAG